MDLYNGLVWYSDATVTQDMETRFHDLNTGQFAVILVHRNFDWSGYDLNNRQNDRCSCHGHDLNIGCAKFHQSFEAVIQTLVG